MPEAVGPLPADAGDPGEPVTPAFGPDGLITAVAQDARSGEVLMVAHMDAAAYRATLRDGYATFWSRSRAALWRKGSTSGSTLRVVTVLLDCDRDAVLLRVEAAGPACHTGARSCFFTPVAGGGAATDRADLR